MRRLLVIGCTAVVVVVAVGGWWLSRDSSLLNDGVATPPAVTTREIACAQLVIIDLRNDGRVDRIYPAACYRRAVELSPDGSAMRGEISRALAFAHPRKPEPG